MVREGQRRSERVSEGGGAREVTWIEEDREDCDELCQSVLIRIALDGYVDT